MLIRELSPGLDSTLCFNFLDETATFELFYDVTGGLGPYEGATGNIVCTGNTAVVALGHTAFVAHCTGNVDLVKTKK